MRIAPSPETRLGERITDRERVFRSHFWRRRNETIKSRNHSDLTFAIFTPSSLIHASALPMPFGMLPSLTIPTHCGRHLSPCASGSKTQTDVSVDVDTYCRNVRKFRVIHMVGDFPNQAASLLWSLDRVLFKRSQSSPSESFHRHLLFPSGAIFTESGLPRPPPEVQFPASIVVRHCRKQSPRKWPTGRSIHPRSGCSLATNIDRDGRSSLVRDLVLKRNILTHQQLFLSSTTRRGYSTPLKCWSQVWGSSHPFSHGLACVQPSSNL